MLDRQAEKDTFGGAIHVRRALSGEVRQKNQAVRAGRNRRRFRAHLLIG